MCNVQYAFFRVQFSRVKYTSVTVQYAYVIASTFLSYEVETPSPLNSARSLPQPWPTFLLLTVDWTAPGV